MSPSRPDFHQSILLDRIDRSHNGPDDASVSQEMLTETFARDQLHSLSRYWT
jgi:hypothetical protein